MSKPAPERWLAFALLALIVSVGLQRLVANSDLVDFLAGLLLGLALALDAAYLLIFDRAR